MGNMTWMNTARRANFDSKHRSSLRDALRAVSGCPPFLQAVLGIRQFLHVWHIEYAQFRFAWFVQFSRISWEAAAVEFWSFPRFSTWDPLRGLRKRRVRRDKWLSQENLPPSGYCSLKLLAVFVWPISSISWNCNACGLCVSNFIPQAAKHFIHLYFTWNHGTNHSNLIDSSTCCTQDFKGFDSLLLLLAKTTHQTD